MYRNHNPPINDISVVTELKKLRRGLKRTEADKKQAGLLPAFQEKAPLAFAGYQILSEYALSETRKDCMYARLFVILCWNLVSRANNVGKIFYSHISWGQDSMLINLPKTKGDQEGANDFYRHLYANPECPHLCPILAMAIHVFSCGYTRHEESVKLFCSPDIQTRFSNWLHDVFERLDNDALGLQGLTELENGGKFGSHSFRKGGMTYALSFPGGPSAIAMYLRACWSLGNVPHRYIFAGDGGDQFAGRVLSSLPLTSVKFAVLPPHFPKNHRFDNDDLRIWLPAYDRFGEKFHPCIPFLVASLAFHYDWIKDNLPSQHPIFYSPIWRQGKLIELRNNVIFDPEKSFSEADGLVATGVPMTIVTAVEVNRLSQKVDRLVENTTVFKEEVKNSLEGVESRIMDSVQGFCQSLPGALAIEMASKFDINGSTAPISAPYLQQVMADQQTQFTNRLQAMFDLLSLRVDGLNNTMTNMTINPTPLPIQQPVPIVTAQPNALDSLNSTRPVPGFEFPKYGLAAKILWDLWFMGNPSLNHRPYMQIIPSQQLQRKDHQYYSRAKKVINTLVTIGTTFCGILRSTIYSRQTTPFQHAEIFDTLYTKYVERMEKIQRHNALKKRRLENRRVGEIGWVTIYNDINLLEHHHLYTALVSNNVDLDL